MVSSTTSTNNIYFPPATIKLPEPKTEFEKPEDKGAYVGEVLELVNKAILLGDQNFNSFNFKEAKPEYTVAAQGLINLMRVTQDDENFQKWVKSRLDYTMERAERSKKNVMNQLVNMTGAGYSALSKPKPVQQDAFMQVFAERQLSKHDEERKARVMGMLASITAEEDKAKAAAASAATAQAGAIPSPSSKPIAGAAPAGDKPAAPKSSVDPEILKQIEESILDCDPNVKFDDVKGLEDVKKIMNETIVLPTQRPDIFKGLLSPAKGILLYGPPGTGKTMLAKAIATECKSTFFNISASTLTSKWMGEGEKLMRALFQLANERAPAVIFIDEIDSIMGARGGQEHEASRRLKTEFLVQFDGVSSTGSAEKNLLVLAATNRPQDLDEAALRRLTRRIYMPLPDEPAREALVEHKLKDANKSYSEDDFKTMVNEITVGYSCADLNAFVKEAAMAPIREMTTEQLMNLEDTSAIRGINLQDFKNARRVVAPSVSNATIAEFMAWQKEKGVL